MKSGREKLIKVLTAEFPDYTEKELYSMIMCGEVKVGDETVREAARKINPEANITIAVKRWVSRGGEKLDSAIKTWDINCNGKVVLDAGASTGGFTDCLIHYGAVLVHSVDVGYNQLDYRLRSDSRVNVLERTNIMSVKQLDPAVDFAVADLSFRSIKGAAGHILRLTSENMLIALVKPQFELADTTGFDGVIRDDEVLQKVLFETAAGLESEGVKVNAVISSPIRGGKGNREFLFKLQICENEEIGNENIIRDFIRSRF